MKEISQYKCEICGTIYSERAKCEACEAGHKRPTKIVARKYRPITINHSGFPDKIEVETKNGERAIYKYIGKADTDSLSSLYR